MREFNYENLPGELMIPEIFNIISKIHECKGRQEMYIEADSDVLTSLLEVAKIQSTESSNRIEGIYTSDARLKELVNEKAEPKNRSEREISGYREVLASIHENYEYITPRPNIILQLHRDLYSFSSSERGGKWKNSDNQITERDSSGITKIRFKPVSAFETEDHMERLCNEFIKAVDAEKYDPLLLIPIFILDFLCIHPFNDGNGRMSRLITLLLMYRSGYIVGKYISIEMIIERTKETYYEVLKESSFNWHEGTNSYLPFVKYYLEIMLKAYVEFENRVEHLRYRKLSKPERIRIVFDKNLGKITKQKIMELCPDISKITVERALSSLLKEGYIKKIGSGRGTAYVKEEK